MFIDPAKFTFTTYLEEHWQEIRDEYLALPESAFDPWVQKQMYGEGWSVYGLIVAGKKIEGAVKQCLRTAQIMASIEGISLAGFSRLAPKTHIEPHVGWAKSVYRLHLGLVVPADCCLKVDNETRSWQAGKCLIFDDTVEHEAWNKSDEVRGTLLLDFLRPGMTQDKDIIPAEVQRHFDQSNKT